MNRLIYILMTAVLMQLSTTSCAQESKVSPKQIKPATTVGYVLKTFEPDSVGWRPDDTGGDTYDDTAIQNSISDLEDNVEELEDRVDATSIQVFTNQTDIADLTTVVDGIDTRETPDIRFRKTLTNGFVLGFYDLPDGVTLTSVSGAGWTSASDGFGGTRYSYSPNCVSLAFGGALDLNPGLITGSYQSCTFYEVTITGDFTFSDGRVFSISAKIPTPGTQQTDWMDENTDSYQHIINKPYVATHDYVKKGTSLIRSTPQIPIDDPELSVSVLAGDYRFKATIIFRSTDASGGDMLFELATSGAVTDDYYTGGSTGNATWTSPGQRAGRLNVLDAQQIPDGDFRILVVEGVFSTIQPNVLTFQWGNNNDPLLPIEVLAGSRIDTYKDN